MLRFSGRSRLILVVDKLYPKSWQAKSAKVNLLGAKAAISANGSIPLTAKYIRDAQN